MCYKCDLLSTFITHVKARQQVFMSVKNDKLLTVEILVDMI